MMAEKKRNLSEKKVIRKKKLSEAGSLGSLPQPEDQSLGMSFDHHELSYILHACKYFLQNGVRSMDSVDKADYTQTLNAIVNDIKANIEEPFQASDWD